MAVQGWANAQEKFEPVTEIVAVIAIESVGTIINCELRPESDVDAVSMQQVAHITECVSTYWKDARVRCVIQDELVSRFSDAFPTKVNRVASMLIIGVKKERLCFALAGVVVLDPDKTVRPIAVVAEWEVVNDRCRCAMPVQLRFERFGAFDVTE